MSQMFAKAFIQMFRLIFCDCIVRLRYGYCIDQNTIRMGLIAKNRHTTGKWIFLAELNFP